MENTDLSAREIAVKSLKIAGEICIYTNDQMTIEELKAGLREDEILGQVIAGLIHVGINLMRGEIPGEGRKSNADVAANLADPNRLSVDGEGRQPQPEVVALVDGGAI
jgi:hypothetical protein